MCIRTLLVSTDIPKTPSPQRNMQLKSWSACPEPFGTVARAACAFFRVATAIHGLLTTGLIDLTTLDAKHRSELWAMSCWLTALFPIVTTISSAFFVHLVVSRLLPAVLRALFYATRILWFFFNAGVVMWLIVAVWCRYSSLTMRHNLNHIPMTENILAFVAGLAFAISLAVSECVIQTVCNVCCIIRLLFTAASFVLYVVAGLTIVGILYLTLTSYWYDIPKDSPVQNPSEIVELAAETTTSSSDALDASEGYDNVKNSPGSVEESSVVSDSAAEEDITEMPVKSLILGSHFNWTVDEESSAVSAAEEDIAEMPKQNVLVKSFTLGGHFNWSPAEESSVVSAAEEDITEMSEQNVPVKSFTLGGHFNWTDEEPPAESDEQVELDVEMPEQNVLVEKPRLHLDSHIHSTDGPAASAELESVGCTTAQNVELTEGLLAESRTNSSLDPVSDINGLDSAGASVQNVGRTEGLRESRTNSSTSSSWESLIDDVDEMMMTSPEYSTVYQPDNRDCTKLPRDGPNPCCEVEDQFVDVTYDSMTMRNNPQ